MKPHYDVVCAVIEKNGLFFCVQRGSFGEWPFMWEFPSGKVNPDESKEAALKRNMLAKFNTGVTVEDFVGESHLETKKFTVTLYAYRCTVIHGTLALMDHRASRWLPIPMLKSLNLVPSGEGILNEIVEQTNPGRMLMPY